MDGLSNELSNHWTHLEDSDNPPKYVSDIAEIDFATLKSFVETRNLNKLFDLQRKLYDGTAFIIRKAAEPALRDVAISIARKYDKTQISTFHKMLDGTPNFHRIIDQQITQNYSLYAIKHSYYLYNWNAKTEDEKNFKEGVYRHWRYVKLLAGNSMFEYENNIPSDLKIDRLQIVNYPLGGGELRDHEDPRHNQRIVSGLIMSRIGTHFDEGGFYFKTRDNTNLNLESRLDIGDSVSFYGSIIHGVEAVDPKKNLDWTSYDGRWFIGMFVNDSDHVLNRATAKDLSNSISDKKTLEKK